jgi:hypothetical protein
MTPWGLRNCFIPAHRQENDNDAKATALGTFLGRQKSPTHKIEGEHEQICEFARAMVGSEGELLHSTA